MSVRIKQFPVARVPRVSFDQMKLLYVVAPWQTRTPDEEATTRAAVMAAFRVGWAPIFYPFVLGDIDGDPTFREKALAACAAIVRRCDAVLVVGDRLTSGMKSDIKFSHDERVIPLYWWPDLPEPKP